MTLKFNLLWAGRPEDVKKGYTNIDPVTPSQAVAADRVYSSIENLDAVADDGEASEILAFDILDRFPAEKAEVVMKNWLSKLAKGGRLTVSVMDIREVSRVVLRGEAEHGVLNELVYGTASKPRRSSYTMSRLVSFFETVGYRVLSKRYHNLHAVVTAQREA